VRKAEAAPDRSVFPGAIWNKEGESEGAAVELPELARQGVESPRYAASRLAAIVKLGSSRLFLFQQPARLHLFCSSQTFSRKN
jgi:hypothetical protein